MFVRATGTVSFRHVPGCISLSQMKEISTWLMHHLRCHLPSDQSAISPISPDYHYRQLYVDSRILIAPLKRVYSTKKLLNITGVEAETTETFSNPMQTFEVVKGRVNSKLGLSISNFKFKKEPSLHVCELQLTWPDNQCFTAVGRRKTSAKSRVCLQALQWLLSKDVITKDGQLNFQDAMIHKNILSINLCESELKMIDSVLKIQEETVAPLLTSLSQESVQNGLQTQERLHPTLGKPFSKDEDLEAWNETLSAKGCVFQNQKCLPIDNYRDAILESLKTSRVVIVKGETGCGKTTRVPQFILDESIMKGQGVYCNIAVVQPRRLTAMQTAKYVAKEREENIGQSVGFSVKMASVLPSVPGGSVTFLTGMKLAQKFASDPSLLGVSHVILDEVHMRDIGTDLVMTLLKQAMMINENLKVIIMSATVDVSIFQSYYSCYGDVPVVQVPGRTFPVQMHFLDDLPFKTEHENREMSEDNNAIVNFSLIQKMVSWINRHKPEGAILVFVSGLNDMAILQKSLSTEENLLIISVHSMFRDCSAAFEPAPGTKRKVILATNIAETSLTFPDVVYVIDCGIHKKAHRNLLSPGAWSSSRMSLELITKANVFQRQGRAGRVQPGESYHLFTKQTFEEMADYELPSIMSESLEYLVLSIKMVNPGVKVSNLLKEFPTPPSKRDVERSVCTLKSSSLLSSNEEPTPLAFAVMKISSSLPSALALIHSAIFRCFSSTLSIIACEETPLVLTPQENESTKEVRALKTSFHTTSDHLAKGKLISDENGSLISHPSLKQTRALKKFLQKQVKSMSQHFYEANLDEYNDEELVKSVLLSSFGSLLVRGCTPSLKFFLSDRSGESSSIKSRSVNYKLESAEFPFFLYMTGHTSRGHLCVSDTSVLSPLTVLLFLPSAFKVTNIESDTVILTAWKRSKVAISIPKEHYLKLQGLREAMKNVLNYFVLIEALNRPDDNFDLLSEYRKNVLDCLKQILTSR